jgi:hypothetical protein
MNGRIKRKIPLEKPTSLDFVTKVSNRPSETITVPEKYAGIMERLFFEFETNPFTVAQAVNSFDGFYGYDHAKSILTSMLDDGMLKRPKLSVDPHCFVFTADDEVMERLLEIISKLSEKQKELKSIYSEIKSKHSKQN